MSKLDDHTTTAESHLDDATHSFKAGTIVMLDPPDQDGTLGFAKFGALVALTPRFVHGATNAFDVFDVNVGARGWGAVVQGFATALATGEALVGDLEPAEAAELGAQAARNLLNGCRWAAAVGERWNTSTVTELLGVSRQALAKRLRNHTLLGLVGTTTTWFPTWQFDRARHEVHDVVRSVLGAFYDLDEDTNPLVIASWAQTAQPDELVGADGAVYSPADWVTAGLDDIAVIDCARRTATRLAQ